MALRSYVKPFGWRSERGCGKFEASLGKAVLRDANLTLLPPKTKYETPAAKTEWGCIALDPYYEGEGPSPCAARAPRVKLIIQVQVQVCGVC